MEPMDPSAEKRRCPRCGGELREGVSAEECPACLLKAGLTVPEPAETVVVAAPPAPRGPLLASGEEMGHYRIVRSIGGGGMGMVFEAEDLETGRRVALKVLSHALDAPEARERFLREGRLAASINHPNSVYVFGTEEIAGTPVIAMELVAGGTLEEKVRRDGPIASTQAVDTVLQMIAGLEAAQRVGILHRDVKPSNCFLDANGTVKIGDFGLSISTAVRTEPALTETGSFLGTPAFCPPEQLRGEELNARSDMYSVGATLFFLLTGRTPFQAKNVVALIATILEQPAPSPRAFAPKIPKGLASIVQRCLDKDPGERFRNYEDLRRALTVHGSAAPVPATLGFRFLAGFIDMTVLSMGTMLALWIIGVQPMEVVEFVSRRNWRGMAMLQMGLLFSILYFGVCEALWGASFGKSLCRLRVVGVDKNLPGFSRAFVRASIYTLAPVLPNWVLIATNADFYINAGYWLQVSAGFSFYAVLALLFSTARRRNGFAAVQDLATGTRVTAREALQRRAALAPGAPALATLDGKPKVGPYHVLETVQEGPEETWVLGYDLRLLRKVWLRLVPPGTPPVPQPLRNIGRASRLRWLTGRRSPSENWDAYEAATGQPLPQLARERQPWSQVRFWLSDLAAELASALKDGTMPAVVAPDRVWITSEGRAKLLDFPAPGLPGPRPAGSEKMPPPLPSAERAQQFLAEVATLALSGHQREAADAGLQVPLPLAARQLLEKLPKLDLGLAVVALQSTLRRPGAVSRGRRLAIVAGCLAVPLLAVFPVWYGVRSYQQWSDREPAVNQLNLLLQQRWSLHRFGAAAKAPTDRQFEIYIAQHFRQVITDTNRWRGTLALMFIKGADRQFAEESVAKHPAPSPEEIADAESAVGKLLPGQAMPKFMSSPWFPLVIIFSTLAVYVCLPALAAALVCRGGLVLWVAGVAFVRKDGRRASRFRVFWRALVAWCPIWVAFIFALVSMNKHSLAGAAFALGLLLVLATLSVALPKRGLPDRLAGTWPVPR